MYSQLFAGVGLGLPVGILVGLSSSPVVSVVMRAFAAGMVTLLGFTRYSTGGESSCPRDPRSVLAALVSLAQLRLFWACSFERAIELHHPLPNRSPMFRRPVTVARRREDGLRTKR